MSFVLTEIKKYGKPVEIVVNNKGSKTTIYTMGIIQPYYHSNNPYKPLTEDQKDYFLLIVSPNIVLSHYSNTTVICEGEKYEVKNINSYISNRKELYKQAVLRRLHE